MVNYLELLRLSSLGYRQRAIEVTTHCSMHAGRSVLQSAQMNEISWPLNADITNTDLEELMFPTKYQNTGMYNEPKYAYI